MATFETHMNRCATAVGTKNSTRALCNLKEGAGVIGSVGYFVNAKVLAKW